MGASSDLSCMGREWFRYDRGTVLLLTAHIQSAKPALVQPNRMRKRDVPELDLSRGFSGCGMADSCSACKIE